MQALIIIDMQMDMQRRIAAGYDHVNGGAPQHIAELMQHFRSRHLPVLHVWHCEQDPASPFHPTSASFLPMECAEALNGEAVFVKSTSSAFASTDLAEHLRRNAIDEVLVTGAVAGYCVNSTVRAGADLGFRMTVVEDAVLGFGLPSANLSARSIFDVTMAVLASDFARLTDSAAVLAS